jgi:predicted DNA-binding protein with PD1-like motif
LLIRDLIRGRSLMARLDHDAEIISQITHLASKEKICSGVFGVIGALKQSELSYYDQKSLEYRKILVEGPAELISASGNISLRDDQPFVHAHVVLSDQDGKVWGGHLSKGMIFAAELYLLELLGRPLKREHDPVTGLYLWSESEDL